MRVYRVTDYRGRRGRRNENLESRKTAGKLVLLVQ